MTYQRNHNRPWTVINVRLGRSEASVRAKAACEGISLWKRGRRPYALRK